MSTVIGYVNTDCILAVFRQIVALSIAGWNAKCAQQQDFCAGKMDTIATVIGS